MGQFNTRQIVNSLGVNNMTGAAIVLSDWIDTAKLGGQCSLEIQITGTPTGTLTVEGTNRPNPAKPTEVDPTATAVPFAAGAMNPVLPAVAGAALSYLGGLVVLGNQGSARWVRLRYVNSGSTGQLNVWSHAAEL